MSRQLQTNVRLIISEHDVVRRTMGLDQAIFEKQRFLLCIGEKPLHPLNLRNQAQYGWPFISTRNQVSPKSIAQPFGFSDIENLPLLPLKEVDPRGLGGTVNLFTRYLIHGVDLYRCPAPLPTL